MSLLDDLNDASLSLAAFAEAEARGDVHAVAVLLNGTDPAVLALVLLNELGLALGDRDRLAWAADLRARALHAVN